MQFFCSDYSYLLFRLYGSILVVWNTILCPSYVVSYFITLLLVLWFIFFFHFYLMFFGVFFLLCCWFYASYHYCNNNCFWTSQNFFHKYWIQNNAVFFDLLRLAFNISWWLLHFDMLWKNLIFLFIQLVLNIEQNYL